MVAPVADRRRPRPETWSACVCVSRMCAICEAVLVGQGEVVLDVPLRIDHRRLSPVCDDVGGAAEILVQHLPEEHSARHDTAVPSDGLVQSRATPSDA